MIENEKDASLVREVAGLVKQTPQIDYLRDGRILWQCGEQKEIIESLLLPEPKALDVATLHGIVDAYRAKLHGEQDVVIHLASPSCVAITAPIVGGQKQTFTYVAALCETPSLPVGYFMNLEDFIINVQTTFEMTAERDRVLAFVGGLTAGIAAEITDTGAAQMVATKRGLTRAGTAEAWQNPVQLAPHRTFAEVEQPHSAFILRLKQVKTVNTEEITAQAGLFEADGGAWKTEAIENIRTWLKAALPDAKIIG